MYGTQTTKRKPGGSSSFENDVKMYGTQTPYFEMIKEGMFENDVKMYGTQTEQERCQCVSCLRMM